MRAAPWPQRVKAALAGAWAGWGGLGLPWLGHRLQAGGASLPAQHVGPVEAVSLPAVYRCCSLLSDACSQSPPLLYQRAATGGRLQIQDSAVARALSTLSFHDAELFAFSTALTGNGYLHIVRDGNGAPAELRAVPPWRVSLEVESGTARIYYRLAADASLEEPEAVLPESDVIHARYRLTGSNRLMGVPPIASCAPAFALALQQRDVQRVLMGNISGARGVLQAPGKIEESVAKRLLERWESNFSGSGVGRVAILGSGLEYKPMAVNVGDAKLVEQMEASVRDVARAYGIPRQFLDSGDHLTYASAAEGTRSLYALALHGFAARLADAFAVKLLTRAERARGAAIEYDLSSMLVLPGVEQAEFLSKLANAGLATPNELRNAYLNLPDVPGGDVLRAPVNTAPAPTWAADAKTLNDLEAYRAELDEYAQLVNVDALESGQFLMPVGTWRQWRALKAQDEKAAHDFYSAELEKARIAAGILEPQ